MIVLITFYWLVNSFHYAIVESHIAILYFVLLGFFSLHYKGKYFHEYILILTSKLLSDPYLSCILMKNQIYKYNISKNDNS